MAAPWERYRQAPAQQQGGAGPWSRYQQSPSAAPDAFAGDDLLSNESMQRLAAGERSTVTPTREPSFIDQASRYVRDYARGVQNADANLQRATMGGGRVLGGADAAATLISGAVAPTLGAVESAVVGTPQEEAVNRYTYQPRSDAGRATLQYIGAVAKPVTDAGAATGADVALAPLAAETQGLQMLPRVEGAGIVRPNGRAVVTPRRSVSSAGDALVEAEKAGQSVQGTAAASGRGAGLASVSDESPSTESLKAASRAAYERARTTGAVIKPESFAKAKGDIAKMLQSEGIDPTLHPSATAALRRISDTEGSIPLDQLETLRRIAKDAEGALAPADRRLAAKIVESLDDYAESIDPRHLSSGTPEAVGAFKEARSLWARARKADTIAEMVDRAQTKAGAHYTQAGMEHALRSEFKSLALNPKKFRTFKKEEQEAIKSIARGGAWENSLRNLGKFDPTQGGMSAFMSTLLAGGGAAATGGLSLLIPAAGFVAKRGATRITSRKVDQLDRMVRGGPINSFARRPPESQRNAFAPAVGEHIEMSGDRVRSWPAPVEEQ